MTRMIPPTPPAGAPPGELLVFDALRDASGTDGWGALHGLPIRHHATQVEGEADFVILSRARGCSSSR